MDLKEFGKTGKKVSPLGFGCMGISHAFGTPLSLEEGAEVIKKAYQMGYNFFDTAECYTGTNPDGTIAHNEDVVGLGIKGLPREKLFICTKTGVDFEDGKMLLDASRERIRKSCETSLKRLGTDYIDLYYLHRIDPKVEPEDVAATMGELIKEGKIKAWGISCFNEDFLRRAHAVTPVTAVQEMYNMVNRGVEEKFELLEELGITLVAYTPLAKGFLSGRYKERPTFDHVEDNRSSRYEFSEEGFNAYQQVLALIKEYADKKNASSTQICLAWEMAKRPYIFPIPGTRNEEHMLENLKSSDIVLTDEEVEAIDEAINNMNLKSSESMRKTNPYKDALKNK